MVGQANSTCKRRIAMHTRSKLHRHTYHSKENYNPVLPLKMKLSTRFENPELKVVLSMFSASVQLFHKEGSSSWLLFSYLAQNILLGKKNEMHDLKP